MFNFKVMNRALNDSNLSDKAFRMLYTITNYCSLKDSNSVEIHNAHFMMVLNITERWVQKITKELVEKRYISKTINGTSKNKLANTYTLIEVEENESSTDLICNDKNGMTQKDAQKDVQKFAQKFTLKNNNKINNNINKLIDIPVVKGEVYKPAKTTIELRSVEVCDSDELCEEDKTNDNNNNNTNFNMEVINNSNEPSTKEKLNDTSTLMEMLQQQANEENTLLKEAYNDNFNFEEYTSYQPVKESHFNTDDQESYTRLFTSTKELIQQWYETHDTTVKAHIESNLTVIGWIYERGGISTKQYETAQTKLRNHFNKLVKGHQQYLQNRPNKKYSARPAAPNENKAVLSHKTDADNKTINRDNKTQQGANKVAKFKTYDRHEQNNFEELIKIGGKETDLKDVVDYIKCHYNGYPAVKMEKLQSFCNNTTFSGCYGGEVYAELKGYIAENIK